MKPTTNTKPSSTLVPINYRERRQQQLPSLRQALLNQDDVTIEAWRNKGETVEQFIDKTFGPALLEAIQQGNVESVKSLLAAGANVHQLIPYLHIYGDLYRHKTPLMLAVEEYLKEWEEINVKIISTEIENLYMYNYKGVKQEEAQNFKYVVFSKLQQDNKRAEIIKLLIEAGADVNEKYTKHEKFRTYSIPECTLLWEICATTLDFNLIKYLIYAGASVNIIYDNRTLLIMLLQRFRNFNPNHSYPWKEDIDEEVNSSLLKIFTLILDFCTPSTINHICSIDTALMVAAAQGNENAIQLLLNKGVDINYQDKSRYETALMRACEQDGHPVVGDTLETVKILLERGANVSLKNRWGKTALDLCGHPDISAVAKYLKAYIKNISTAPTLAQRMNNPSFSQTSSSLVNPSTVPFNSKSSNSISTFFAATISSPSASSSFIQTFCSQQSSLCQLIFKLAARKIPYWEVLAFHGCNPAEVRKELGSIQIELRRELNTLLAEQHTNFITAIQSAEARGIITHDEARICSHINKAANDAKHEVTLNLEAGTLPFSSLSLGPS